MLCTFGFVDDVTFAHNRPGTQGIGLIGLIAYPQSDCQGAPGANLLPTVAMLGLCSMHMHNFNALTFMLTSGTV